MKTTFRLFTFLILLGSLTAFAFGQDDSGFYGPDVLKGDFNQVDAVAYVNVKSRILADQIGSGDCEKSIGTGYCLYLLKAEVKEVYKGRIKKGILEFYTSPDMDYKPKDILLGEHVVFLNWGKNSPDKKLRLFTMENSTRGIRHGILKKMRKISNQRTK